MARLTAEDKAFIDDNFEVIGAKACAEAIGCSPKTIYNFRGKGKKGAGSAKRTRTYDTLTELKRSKNRLIASMATAPPATMAGLSKELRAVMAEIDRMEGGDDGDDPLADFAAAFAERM